FTCAGALFKRACRGTPVCRLGCGHHEQGRAVDGSLGVAASVTAELLCETMSRAVLRMAGQRVNRSRGPPRSECRIPPDHACTTDRTCQKRFQRSSNDAARRSAADVIGGNDTHAPRLEIAQSL